MTEDETVGWHHRLNGHGFGWTPGVGDRQGGLACCGSWGRKESDMTERLNLTERWLSLPPLLRGEISSKDLSRHKVNNFIYRYILSMTTSFFLTLLPLAA